MSKETFIKTLTQISEHATEQGIIYLNTDDDTLSGNTISVDHKQIINFGSCSYLGLEFDERVKSGAINAIQAYGTQFSCSRAYISARYYKELEDKLELIFGAPTISTPTTTLGHMSAIPVLVSPADAVILDHQVHSSVQTAVSVAKAQRTHVELMRHNRMDLLEERILALKDKHEKVWYMADGIYSMFGDAAPLVEIRNLLDKYPHFHFYVDDAHGMSVFGKNGRGYVLSKIEMHERMIVATSFAKGFGTGGGALVFPNRKLANTVMDCGGTLRASGPMQPAALGAAIASADIHLSNDITIFQDQLQENIRYANLALKKLGLPNLAHPFSPIFFIAVSLPKIAYRILNGLKNDGFFLNLGIFPAVPIKNTGIRFTITRLHTFEQIDAMINCLKKHFDQTLIAENLTTNEILKWFKTKPLDFNASSTETNQPKEQQNLNVQLEDSILAIDKKDWNRFFAEKGSFDWANMRMYEEAFNDNEKEHENWKFKYLIIRDNNKSIVLATFFTVFISKDDMLAPKEISSEIEALRVKNPTYMTSKTLSLGSPITEGEHLYLDQNSSYKQKALSLLIKTINTIQEQENITTTILRDFQNNDKVMDSFFVDNGFFKLEMPESAKIKNTVWVDKDHFYQNLSKKKKGHFRRNINKHIDKYSVNIVDNPTEEELKHFYELYKNVKNKSLELNTFRLPYKLFRKIVTNPNWEIIALSLKGEYCTSNVEKTVAVGFCNKSTLTYSFVFVGLDYNYNFEHGCYRQLLFQVIKRAGILSCKNIDLGFTSLMEKRHFGAKPYQACAYMQVNDNFKMESLEVMTLDTKKNDNGINKRGVFSI